MHSVLSQTALIPNITYLFEPKNQNKAHMQSSPFRGILIDPPLKHPYNCIGSIKLHCPQQQQQTVNLTGFLIAQNLVLTSNNGFFIERENSLLSLLPLSFTLIEPDTTKREYSIKEFRLNPLFVSLEREYREVFRIMQQCDDQTQLNRLKQKAINIQMDKIRHDFALLKLAQKALRPRYLQLEPYLPPNITLTVAGYHYEPTQIRLASHSNKLTETSDNALYYDIDVRPGQGGSPVLVQSLDWKVVGIHKGINLHKKLRFATKVTPALLSTVQNWQQEMTKINEGDNLSAFYCEHDIQIYKNEMLLKGWDRRKQVIPPQIEQSPFNCIGWLRGINAENKQVLGTGILISECLVLTSAHTIRAIVSTDHFGSEIPLTFSTETQREVKIKNFRVNHKYLDYENQVLSLQAMRKQMQSPHEIEDINEQIKALYRQQSPFDFALLELEQYVPRTAYFQLASNCNLALCKELTVSGYVNCHSEKFDLLTHSGKVGTLNQGVVSYDVDTTSGQSGAPVYLPATNQLVAIHKGYSSLEKLNFGTVISKEMVDTLRTWALQMRPPFSVAE